MGRQVAGNTFLKAFFKYTNFPEFYVYSSNKTQAEDFYKFAREEGRNETIKFIDLQNTAALAQPGLLFYPGPDIAVQAKKRSLFKNSGWSICGVTHTTATDRIMDSFQSFVSSPLEPWDAVICTSSAVHSNVLKIIESEEENLKQRLNAKTFIRPQLPIIPLGINCSEFKFTDNEKIKARDELGINREEIVILYVGRLSFHAKANPFPMYKALEKAAVKSEKKLVLIECGFYGTKDVENAYKKACDYLSPSIRVIRTNGTDQKLKSKSYAAAQIFCSLSDNVQETFGITPLEAMAAGLPVVVSDWDGYKDTVRNNIDGFLIPTIMPPSGFGKDLSNRYALSIDSYDKYIGYLSNFISVDIDKTADIFYKLITNEKLRNTMGLNAKKRANEKYDWNKIIFEYEDLWSNLKSIKNKSNGSYYIWSARLDPFHIFSSYPSNTISKDTLISLKNDSAALSLIKYKELKNLMIITYAKYTIPHENFVEQLFKSIEKGSKKISQLEKEFINTNQAYITRSIVWLNKYNLIKIID
tara:strand:- start:6671 stop:8254 length:1584 start_codon:yes stop_codon:yes gene_type:complete